MLVTPEQWPMLSRLLDEALGLEPEARDRWLASLPPADAVLGEALRALLASHAAVETSDFLEALPRFGVPPADDPAGAANDALAPGTVIGGYVIEAEAGRGGMSVVYRARRADGLIRRPVALKLLQAGHYDGAALARFARERDILAGLTHPNIARLYDAGTTEAGRPYIALEFVEGAPLTAYCDRHRLDLRARLALFRRVLGAVQFAHSSLVIHRDLKPSNILVAEGGEVRLLDFGIAKLLQPEGVREPAATELGQRALTPDYAAPEQIRGEPVSTASDVYALGVVLCELLCGSRPYRLKRGTAAALEEAILGADPIRPSEAATAADGSSVAAARASTPRALARALAGDLDTIVLKALKKHPAERYATADAFEQDLARYLGGEPVLARPDAAWYRARRFLGRHWLAVAALLAVVLSLSVGLGMAVSQAREARRQAALADHEARKAKAVQAFLVELLETNTDTQEDPVRARNRTAREILDASAGKLEARLGAEPEVEEAVLSTLVDMYIAVGLDEQAARLSARRIETLKTLRGVDDPAVAEELLSYAEIIDPLRGSPSALVPLAQARGIVERRPDTPPAVRGRLLRDTARVQLKLAPADALAAAEAAVAYYRQALPGDSHLDAALSDLARARLWLGDLVGADQAYTEAIAVIRRAVPDSIQDLVTALLGRGENRLLLGRVAEAEADFRTALDESTRRNGPEHEDTVHVETRLGALLHATGRRAEGRRLLERAASRLGQGPEFTSPNLVGPVKRNLGMALVADGRWQAAAAPLEENLALKRRIGYGVLVAAALDDLAVLHTLTGRYPAAHEELDEAAATWAKVTGGKADPARANRYVLHAGRLLLVEGDPVAAAARFAKVATPRDAAAMPLDADRVAADTGLAAAALATGDADSALRHALAARERLERAATRAYWPTLEAEALLELGRAQLRLRQHAGAKASLERALKLRVATEDAQSPWIAEVEAALGEAALAGGDVAAARGLVASATRIVAAHRDLGEQFRAPVRALGAAIRIAERTPRAAAANRDSG